MLASSAALAITRCLCVCPSIMFMDCVKTNKHIFKKIFPSGSHAILFFLYQTAWQYFDGNPLTGASSAGRVGRNRDSEPISGFTVCCELVQRQVQYTYYGEFITLVAGTRRSLLMAGNNDEVYDEKLQHFSEDNVMQR